MDLSHQEKLEQLDQALDQVDLEDAPFARKVLLEAYWEVDAELAEMQQVELGLNGEQELI